MSHLIQLMENQVKYVHNAEKFRKEPMKNVRIVYVITKLKQNVILMYTGKLSRKSQLNAVKKRIPLQRRLF
jgi:hypothetical protein